MRRVLVFLLALLLSGSLGGAPASAAPQPSGAPIIAAARRCSDMTRLGFGGLDVTIASATAVPAGLSPAGPRQPAVQLPAYCRVEGSFEHRAGVGGKPYAIGFALALPDAWNGRFLFQGGGGLNGTVGPPLGATAAGEAPALARGYAVVSMDSGHKGAVFDASFMDDQQAALNFAYAALGKTARLAKAMIAEYYGRPARHSYFVGCSTGGREAMIAAERYPMEFDGIVSGDPAIRTGHSNTGLAWALVAFNRIAPRDASGVPNPALAFSAADKRLVVEALTSDCDALDGVKDGMIFNAGACRFDPARLQCRGAKADGCLTAAQVEALKTAFAGPKDSRGVQLYPAFPFDIGIGDEGRGIPGLLSGPVIPVGAPNHDTSIDLDRRSAELDADPVQRLSDTDASTNLTSFFGHGGKLIFYHGLSDPWFSPLDTVGYYTRMTAANGGEAVRSSSRLFLVPGMGHCGGGAATLDQFDLLSAIAAWTEDDRAPDAIVATGAVYPGRSRPLCAYPKYAHYKGAGDPEKAASFECRIGEPLAGATNSAH